MLVSNPLFMYIFILQVAASMQKETDFIPNYPNLPSKLICMLHNVTLHVCNLFAATSTIYSYKEKYYFIE